MSDRYEKNPFLRLLDCYVLASIDRLDPVQRAALRKLEPRLRNTFGLDGTWEEIVESQMSFTQVVPERIREFWKGYQEHAEREGVPISADNFVVDFVNQNFPDVVAFDAGRD